MIGKEIADALAPIVMWIAIVGGVIGLVALVRYWVRRGAKKEERLDVVVEGKCGEDEAREEVRGSSEALRERLRTRRRRKRQRLPYHEDSELPPTG